MIHIINQIKTWCIGKQWWWRLPILLWFVYELKINLQDPMKCVFHLLNLPIHELGHLIFGLTRNEFFSYLGGSLIQLLAPIVGMWNFWKQEDFFAIALCFGWLSTNLFSVAAYIHDARSMQIPLVSISGGEPIHDWNYILSHLGVLSFDHLIAGFVWVLAILSMLVCYVSGSWILYRMFKG